MEMINLYVASLETESRLTKLETPIIPKIGETLRFGSDDQMGRQVLSVDYTFATGDNKLTYVTVVVGPQRRLK